MYVSGRFAKASIKKRQVIKKYFYGEKAIAMW